MVNYYMPIYGVFEILFSPSRNAGLNAILLVSAQLEKRRRKISPGEISWNGVSTMILYILTAHYLYFGMLFVQLWGLQ